MNVSVIIPTHNRRSHVLAALAALQKQDYGGGTVEVIVVCDRCTDGTQEAISHDFPDVRLHTSPAPGQAAALNAGIEAARGELAIFLDDEMLAVPSFISAHVAAHAAQESPVAVTGYAPAIVDSKASAFQRYLAENYRATDMKLRGRARPAAPVDLNGGNFSIPLSLIRAKGGFSVSYFQNRIDFELAARLIESGHDILYSAEARADQRIALVPADVVRRASDRAAIDVRLAREHPWCISYLPFARVYGDRAVRRRWRALWTTSEAATGVLALARRIAPESVRAARWEYAIRYIAGLRVELGSWPNLMKLAPDGDSNH